METRNKGFVIVGVVLLVIGLRASFYKVTRTVGQAPAAIVYQIVYPYQIVGIILLLAGIVFMALEFLLLKQIMQKTPPQPQQARASVLC
jgi:drug/metabolite transporter (DMT)-like permease